MPKDHTKGAGGRAADRIAEGEELQTFSRHEDEDEDEDEEAHEPPTARLRSHSWAEGSIMRPPSTGFPARGADAADGRLAHYESMPKIYRRVNRHSGQLNSKLLRAVKDGNVPEVERLLAAWASPNATCHSELVSALHLAALHGGGLARLLLAAGAERARRDPLGRTPLHLAAWAGHRAPLAALLALPPELLDKMENEELSEEMEREISECSNRLNIQEVIDARCHLGDADVPVPEAWLDNIDHSCRDIDLPWLAAGWTALHAAASAARAGAVRALLAAGAEPCARDLLGRTPLDVAGSACLTTSLHTRPPERINAECTAVIELLLSKACRRASLQTSVLLDTPLHTAVELENAEAAALLLQSGISPRNMNRAGLTPLHLCVKKRLKQFLRKFLYYDAADDGLRFPGIVDAVDKDGNTVLHYAVLNNWLAGVCVCLEAGANILQPANNRDTPIHTAAALGNTEVLREIILYARSNNINVIDVTNLKGETALFKAIIKNQTECVKVVLQEGASIRVELPRQYNVFHVAARLGHADILRALLDHDYMFTREKVNAVTADDRRGFGPIHFAIENNHIECVKLVLSKNAFISLKTASGVHKESTPLHIAARKNNLEIAKIIIKFDASTVHNVDAMGWTPLHTASYYACRDVIRLLIAEGADLSASTTGPQKYQKTVVDVMMENLSKPTEFLESIFDMCIHRPCTIAQSIHGEPRLQDPDTEVIVDYNVLLPKREITCLDMKLTVIEAILRTGNRSGQRRLLIHPLVESYLCLRWKPLLPFFYVMLLVYGVFVLTLTVFVMTDYGYRDTPKNESKVGDDRATEPVMVNPEVFTCALYVTIAIVLLQEVIFLSASVKHYIVQKETWVKLTSIVLAAILPTLVATYPSPAPGAAAGPPPPPPGVDWPRHVATLAVVLCWLDMTFLLSRFPGWGYYVLMFGKVCVNVVKILLTFAFLVVGFALSFMIQFHHKASFETFWAALVKTMVMMTSEFDYDDLVDKKDTEHPQLHSLAIIRLVFLIFLILGAIVLMNLLVGVAVHDLHNLELHGHIMRLEKQVGFLASLETLVLRKIFTKVLPSKWVHNLRNSTDLSQIYLRPCEPSCSSYKAIPDHVREAIFEKAVSKTKNEEQVLGFESVKKQLNEIQEAIASARGGGADATTTKAAARALEPAPLRLSDTDLTVFRMKRQVDKLVAKVDALMDMIAITNQNCENRNTK